MVHKRKLQNIKREYNMTTDFIKLIETSILNDEDKKKLLDIFHQEGESDNFMTQLDRLLADEFSRRGEQYNELVLAFDTEIVKLETEIEERKAKADAELQTSLRKIDPFDVKRKTAIYESFYSTLENLENEHLDRLQKITAQYTMKAIN